jgi:hypothetical protein
VTGQDGRTGGLDRVGAQGRIPSLQGAGNTRECAAGADQIQEDVDLPARLFPELGAGIQFVGPNIPLAHELVGTKRNPLCDDLCRPRLD